MVVPFRNDPPELVNLVSDLSPNGLVNVRLLLVSGLDLLGSGQATSELLSLVPAVVLKLSDLRLEILNLFVKSLALLNRH